MSEIIVGILTVTYFVLIGLGISKIIDWLGIVEKLKKKKGKIKERFDEL